jgi:hypothetical protein
MYDRFWMSSCWISDGVGSAVYDTRLIVARNVLLHQRNPGEYEIIRMSRLHAFTM